MRKQRPTVDIAAVDNPMVDNVNGDNPVVDIPVVDNPVIDTDVQTEPPGIWGFTKGAKPDYCLLDFSYNYEHPRV